MRLGGDVTSMKKKKYFQIFVQNTCRKEITWKIFGGEAWRRCGLDSSGSK